MNETSKYATSLVSLLPEHLKCKLPIMQDIKISTAGVNKLLSGLNVSKAAGPDAIRPIALKELCQEITPVVALIFQTSFDSGIVPADWKKAQVCPLFKKGNKTDPANDRPISLTCILCKSNKVAKIRNRYNQVPHLTQDTNGKVTNSQKTPQTRAKRSALSQHGAQCSLQPD